MLRYLVRRVLQMIPVLFIITLIVFLFVNLSGDPTSMLLAPEATLDDREEMREALGLNRPLHIQYGIFLVNALRGDFGTSFRYKLPAVQIVREKIPLTVQLTGISLVLSIVLGVVLGVLSAMAHDTPFDFLLNGLSALGRAMPNFWMGIMLILFFGVIWRVLPLSGHGTWLHLVLPCSVLAIQNASRVIPLVRSNMLEIMHLDYIRTARSKGLREKVVIFKHAFKNALLPVVTFTALQIPTLVGGALVTETVFAWPGVGQLIIQSISTHDMSVVQACVVMIAVITMIANLLADVLYSLIDPRIRY
ncbi:MAG: ABC transporter permease [Synergistaceae bacterium]|jgi:peptide/nickel transport system permease protein|nr:ABC transporter permease [Synergistaceae bacterium]